MASRAEQHLSRSLRAALAGLPVGASVADSGRPWGEALWGLAYFLPQVLGEVHPEWEHGAMDDYFLTASDRKSGEGQVELLGLCSILAPSSLCGPAPVHVRLGLSPAKDEVAWLECRLGERREGRLARVPNDSLHAAMKRFRRVGWRADRIDWLYHVGFGRPEDAALDQLQALVEPMAEERRRGGGGPVVDPSWLSPTVVALVHSILADRALDRLPILADALQEAGCDDQHLLDHLRSGAVPAVLAGREPTGEAPGGAC